MRKIRRSHNSTSRAMEICGSWFSCCVCFLEGIVAVHKGPRDIWQAHHIFNSASQPVLTE